MSYFHIQACGPGGVADADGGFAERILNFLSEKALNKGGFLVFPHDWQSFDLKEGELR